MFLGRPWGCGLCVSVAIATTVAAARAKPLRFHLAGGGARAVSGAHVGFGLRWPNFGLGPYAGFEHVFQAGNTLRPDDANILLFGLHAMFGSSGAPPETDADRDGDGIPDSRDKCPLDPEDKDG